MEPEFVGYLRIKYPALVQSLGESAFTQVAFVIQNESLIHRTASAPRNIRDNSICPYDFQGLDNSGDCFMAAYFNWRWLPRDQGQFRCVTVEFGNNRQPLSLGPPTLKPRDLCAFAPDYHEGLHNASFNWRWFERGEEKFRVVTLESLTNVDVSFPVAEQVSPRHLMGLPSDNQEWKDLKFYWRWMNRGEDRYRVLTLE